MSVNVTECGAVVSRIVACRAYRVTEAAGLGVVKDGSEAVLK